MNVFYHNYACFDGKVYKNEKTSKIEKDMLEM